MATLNIRRRGLVTALAGASALALCLGVSHFWHGGAVTTAASTVAGSSLRVPTGLASAVATSPDPGPGPGPDANPAPEPAPVANPSALGVRRAYAIDHTQTVALGAAKGSSAASGSARTTLLTTRLRSDLSITTIASDKGRDRFAARLSSVNAQANGQPYADAAMPKDLARPFSFETDRDGKIVAIAFEVGTSADARGMLKSLLADTQIVLRGHDPTSTGAAWTTREEDPTGEYEAHYSRSDATHLEKTRTKYLRLATERGLRDVSEVGAVATKDDAQIVLSADGSVSSIAAKLVTDMKFGQGMPEAHTTSQLTSRLAAVDRDPTSLAVLNDAWKRQQKVEMASPPAGIETADKNAAQREADQQIVKDAKLVDLERGLAALPASASRERSAQIHRLQADFRLHPEDTKRAVRDVRTASIADGQAITAALGGAATNDAMKALVDIASANGTPMDVRMNAIGALAINPTPSAASVQGLSAMASDGDPDIHAASTLALGGAASALRDSDPSTYQAAVGTLLSSYDAAQSPQERVLSLRALGNAGDPQVLPLAEAASKDQDITVRMAAVSSVRFVPGAEADGLLMGVMQDDAEPQVRSQAVATAEGYRALGGYMSTLGIVLQNDGATLVRRSVVHALNVVRTTPEALALLNYVARGDASDELRKMAAAVIESTGTVATN